MQAATQTSAEKTLHSSWYIGAMERLVEVVQELSQARDTAAVIEIVRKAARELTGADGAAFVLRDGDQCYYAEENAIGPLWKGRRFPMEICISGWAMLNAKPAVIEDIYRDSRIPADAYRPTFVKSLAMVPIRRSQPIGAIGNYWAKTRMPTDEEVAILQALADTTSVALENVQLYSDLQAKIRALQETNYELSRFTWVASHDLREPLRTIVTQVELLERRYGNQLGEKARGHIERASQGANRLQALVSDLLVHAQSEKTEDFSVIDLTQLLQDVQTDMQAAIDESKSVIQVQRLPKIQGSATLLERVFLNLFSNAIKFQQLGISPEIIVSSEQKGNEWIISVRDNGIGIEPAYHQRIFGLFQRLYSQDMYPGSGIGLANCKKIIELHGGKIWVESSPGVGSDFRFTLPAMYGDG